MLSDCVPALSIVDVERVQKKRVASINDTRAIRDELGYTAYQNRTRTSQTESMRVFPSVNA
jgi:ssDNA-binding replication factor A large subunit